MPLILVSSCSNSNNTYYLKQFASGTGFKNISEANVLFYYNNLTGWDSSGPLYYVLDYSNVDSEIRFINTTSKERTFTDGRDDNFEGIVDTFIKNKLGDAYINFNEEYKINWDKSYKYYSANEKYIGTALIYYEDSEVLYILSYKVG